MKRIMTVLMMMLSTQLFAATCNQSELTNCRPACNLSNQGSVCTCNCAQKEVKGTCGWIGGLHTCHMTEKPVPINL